MNSVAVLVEPHVLSCWGKVQAWEGTGNRVVLTCGLFPVWREDIPRPEVSRRTINIWGRNFVRWPNPIAGRCAPRPHPPNTSHHVTKMTDSPMPRALWPPWWVASTVVRIEMEAAPRDFMGSSHIVELICTLAISTFECVWLLSVCLLGVSCRIIR